MYLKTKHLKAGKVGNMFRYFCICGLVYFVEKDGYVNR